MDVCSARTGAERRSQRPVDAVRQRPEWSEETRMFESGRTRKKEIHHAMYLFSPERETAQDVQWTSALRGPERSVDLERSSPAGLDLTKKDIHRMSFFVKRERETGLEPAAPTLARSCSTN